jgi:alpha-tubulin suppressor-like RCC1 family protein
VLLWAQVLNHARARFVDVATGKRHSLLVTQDGLVLSTGEGRGQQLGGTRLGSEPVILR